MDRLGKIESRILKINLLLIIIPLILILIFSGIQLSLLTNQIGTDGQETLKEEGIDAVENSVSYVADNIRLDLYQITTDLDRIISYEQDLINDIVKTNEERMSYHQKESPYPPDLKFSSRYSNYISEKYSDYVNTTNINIEMEDLINKTAYIDLIADSIYESNSAYVGIYIAFENNISRFFPYLNNSRPFNQDLKNKNWYINTKNSGGSFYYNDAYISYTGPAIIISKSVYDKNDVFIGVTGIEIELKYFRSLLSEVDVPESGYLALIETSGSAIVHPSVLSYQSGANILYLESNSVEFLKIIADMGTGSSGTEKYEKDDDDWIVSYVPIGVGGYVVAEFVPYEDILESGEKLQENLAALNTPLILIFVFVMIGILIIIFFSIIFISRKITKPIIKLKSSLDGMIRGDLSKEIALDKKHEKDEIGFLAKSFQALLTTMRLGNESYYKGNIYLAYKNYIAALELFKTTENLKGQGICLNNLGNIFRIWGQFQEASESYDKSIEIARKMNDLGGLSSRLNNRGLLFLSEGNWEKAKKDFEECIKIDEETMSNDRIAIRKRNMGVLYLLKNDTNIALKYLQEAININTDLDLESALAEDYFQYGRLYIQTKNLELASDYLTKALNLSKKYENYPLIRNILNEFMIIYDEQDNIPLLHKTKVELAKINETLTPGKDVIFVIDQSGSMGGERIRSAKKGAIELFNTIINPADRIAIIGFHSKIENILPLTVKQDDAEEIYEKLRRLTHTEYMTMFYDAIGSAIDIILKSSKQGQKWVVALTDGQDNASVNYGAAKLANRIKELEIPINIILIGVGKELRAVHNEMVLIVKSSVRGKYIPIYSEKNVSKEIDKAFKRVKEIMVSSEIEGFTPEAK